MRRGTSAIAGNEALPARSCPCALYGQLSLRAQALELGFGQTDC